MKIGSSQGQRARSVASETVSGRGGGLVGLLLLLRHRWGNVRSGVVVVAATIVIVTVVLLYPQMSTGVGSPVGEGGDSMAAATALAGADASTSMGAPGGAGGYDLGESIHGAYRAALVSDASGLPPLVPLALQAPEFVTSDGGIEVSDRTNLFRCPAIFDVCAVVLHTVYGIAPQSRCSHSAEATC